MQNNRSEARSFIGDDFDTSIIVRDTIRKMTLNSHVWYGTFILIESLKLDIWTCRNFPSWVTFGYYD